MRLRDPRLRLALAAALVHLGPACVTTPPTETDPPGTEQPPDLDELCAADSLLGYFTLTEPVEFLALRRASDMSEPEELETWGTPCGGAANVAACETTLAETWPSTTGWGYCGEGCSWSGLVYTRGDEVGVADTYDEVRALFGAIDTAAEALFLVRASEYEPSCSTLVQNADGSYEFEATFLTSDCPWTTENRQLHVDTAGTTEVLDTLSVDETSACAGRRPDGLIAASCDVGDEVGRHLAEVARLEAAAVVAFERLAVDLARFDAPADLIARARRAARDEVRHARMMGALAARRGVVPPAVEVEPHRPRSFFAFAVENATEGCVRETFGVADGLYRARHAPTAALRATYGRIARDEARHAELSRDVARWAEDRLDAAERAQLQVEQQAAYDTLESQLAAGRQDAVQLALGAPSPAAAVHMAMVLRKRLAA